MNGLEDQSTYRKELYGAIIAAISLTGTILGLLSDIPQVSSSPIGKTILIITLLAAVGYLVGLFYTRFIREYFTLKKRLQEIRDILVDFTSKNANAKIEDLVDIEQINIVSTTRWAKRLSIKVRELQHLPDGKIKIVTDKGRNDGLIDDMQFKVFHNSRLQELGICACTAFHDQSSLVLELPPDCPITLGEINREAVEVRLIDPDVKNKITILIGDLFHKVDYG